MANVATILSGVYSAVKLTNEVKKMVNSGPIIPKELKNSKERYVSVTVFNQTQYKLHLVDDYFDSGRFWDAPKDVNPFSQISFTGCEVNTSILTGVSGGAHFKLFMPCESGDDAVLEVSVGFTNPTLGAYKASAIFGDAKQAYDAVTDSTMSNESETYQAKIQGENNESKSVFFTISSSPGPEATFTISEEVR